MVSQKVENTVIASKAKQSPVSQLIVIIRLLRRCTPRNDLRNDFLRVHQIGFVKNHIEN